LRSQSHSYRAYGLSIASDIELPELVPGPPGGDIRIRRDTVDPVPDPGDGSPLWWAAEPTSARITFPPVGSFLVRAGKEIVLDPIPDADPGLLRQVVLGPGLAIVLTQRGLTTLHASAVAIDGGGVIFLGGAGGGKSTTAGVMHARGHPLIADDAVAVAGTPEAPLLPPGFPRLKLWPEAASSIGIDTDDLNVLYPDLEKRGWTVPRGFATAALPPTHVYVLAEGPAVAIEPMAPAESVIELIRNAHGVMSMYGIDASSQLQRVALLAGQVKVRRLTRPLSLDSLFEVAEAVEADVASG
jgi:hypothetical protein